MDGTVPPLRAPVGESNGLYKSVFVLQVQASCTSPFV